MSQLRLALPEMSEGARSDLIRKSAIMLGRNFFDMMTIERLAGTDGYFVTPVGDDGVFGELGSQLEMLLAQGRGLFLLTGHIGCWELLGARMAWVLDRRGLGPLAVVSGTVRNPPVDRLLQNRRRDRGLKVLARRNGLRPLVEHIKVGGVAALLLDQKISDQDPLVEFFGRPAPTPNGMVRIALRQGTPILPVAMVWDNDRGCHVIHRRAVLNVTPATADIEQSPQMAVDALQQECQSALESFIRRNPEQWVWFHERWLNEGMRACREGQA